MVSGAWEEWRVVEGHMYQQNATPTRQRWRPPAQRHPAASAAGARRAATRMRRDATLRYATLRYATLRYAMLCSQRRRRLIVSTVVTPLALAKPHKVGTS